jgi:thiamine-monophosphate kinase
VINFLKLDKVVWCVKHLADIGERAAIQRIATILTKGKNDTGIGDDCAAIDLGTKYLLVTTDMISQHTHIPPQMTPCQIGWFLVAINLSDLAAKGGTPLGLVLSLGLPKETSERFLIELATGADACATSFGTTIVGGDTKECREITLTGTAFGLVKKNEFMPRKGASPSDVVAVTGTLGKAGAGYYALKRKSQKKNLSEAFLEPVPRLTEGRVLSQQHTVTSSMDISDGLSSSLYQLGEINHVGFEITKSALPLAMQLSELMKENHGIDPYQLALHFGGDYELLVTLPEASFEKARKALQRHGTPLCRIGTVTRKKDIVLIEGSQRKVLENKGYEHFKHQYFK